MRVALERWVGWFLYNPSYTPGVQPYRGNLALPALSATRTLLRFSLRELAVPQASDPSPRAPLTSEEVKWRR